MTTIRKSSNLHGRCYPAPRPLPPNFTQLARDAERLFVEVEDLAEIKVRREEAVRKELPPFGRSLRTADPGKRWAHISALVRALQALTDERWESNLLLSAAHAAAMLTDALTGHPIVPEARLANAA